MEAADDDGPLGVLRELAGRVPKPSGAEMGSALRDAVAAGHSYIEVGAAARLNPNHVMRRATLDRPPPKREVEPFREVVFPGPAGHRLSVYDRDPAISALCECGRWHSDPLGDDLRHVVRFRLWESRVSAATNQYRRVHARHLADEGIE